MTAEHYSGVMKLGQGTKIASINPQIRRERRPSGQGQGDIISQIE
jgi:hypothetical protein